jgi:hypothetical protein
MAERSLPPPTIDYLNDLETDLVNQFQDDDHRIDNLRAQREMKVPAMTGADRTYTLVEVDPRDPDISEEAFQQTAIFSQERPKLHLKSQESDTAQTQASLREHWTEAVFQECGSRDTGFDTMDSVIDHCLNDGGAWAKILWLPDAWDQRYAIAAPEMKAAKTAWDNYDKATEDAKKKAGPPFAWVGVDPRTVYPVRSGGRLCEVIELTERPARSTLRRYGLARDAKGEIVPEELGQPQPRETVQTGLSVITYREHWDEQWATWSVCGYTYEGSRTGRIVKQFRHGYPFGVPYDFAPGLWMSFWKNHKVGWGISQTKLWLVQYRQYLRAMHAQYVARDLLSPQQMTGGPEAAQVVGDDGIVRYPGPRPGELLVNPPGRQIQPVQYPDPGTLEKHMQLIDNAIQQLESPKVTQLGGLEGAGFAISQVLNYSRVRVTQPRNGIERLLKGQTEKLWALVDTKVQEKVWVGYMGEHASAGYISQSPSDLERPVQIEWEVQQSLPTDDAMKARYAHERLQAGTWGLDETIEYLGDNPDEIRRSKARDRIRSSPQYQMWLDQQVFALAGSGDMLAKSKEAQDSAGAMLPAPQSGTPQPPQGMMAPGVFEGGGGGAGGGTMPDMAALAAAPGGVGVNPPPGPAVMAGAAANAGGAPGAGPGR